MLGGWASIGSWERTTLPHLLGITTITLPPLTTMTRKQLRDLQLFAVELAREGRHEAAREVLALIARG